MTGTVKCPVTIAIRRPSKTPAVFVAACFTEPAWEPVELTPKLVSSKDASATEDSSTQAEEYEFSRQFELLEGKFQYKFRLGTDEGTWFCDEAVETGKLNSLSLYKHNTSPHLGMQVTDIL